MLAALGKSEFGLGSVVGGMIVVVLLPFAMRLSRGGIAAVEDDMRQTYTVKHIRKGLTLLSSSCEVFGCIPHGARAYVCSSPGTDAPAPQASGCLSEANPMVWPDRRSLRGAKSLGACRKGPRESVVQFEPQMNERWDFR